LVQASWLIHHVSTRMLRVLPEIKLEGVLGGSIVITCPLPKTPVRMYLCRTMAVSGICTTVVSNKNFVLDEFKDRVTLEPCPDKKLFLVEVTELTERDSGVYACGVGTNTNRGKTQQIILTVHNYRPPWEEDLISEPPAWFNRLLQMRMSPRFPMPAHAKTTPTQRTKAPPAYHTLSTPSVTHRPRVSRVSSVAPAEPTTFLPSTTASKTSAREELLRPQTASYNHQTRLHRAFNQRLNPASGMEEQGFHILIPAALGLILLALLGLLAKRVFQRRKALSRRVRRLALRMRALEASQRPRILQRARTQNNVYSACPRRPRRADAAGGEGAAPLPGPGAQAPSVPQQVPETPWLPAPPLKIGCEYVRFYHQPAAETGDPDSDDYVNVPCLSLRSSCPPRPRPWCQ
uniref:Fc mu receptor n=1 Tax=Catagonus wagneri TaxID=51154 RepID=A0A8C3VPA9_9CETA